MSAGCSTCTGEERSFEIVFNATAPHRPKHCDLEKFTRPRRLCSMLWDPLFSSTILLTSSSTFSCLPGLSRITSRSRSAACMSYSTPNATKLCTTAGTLPSTCLTSHPNSASTASQTRGSTCGRSSTYCVRDSLNNDTSTHESAKAMVPKV